MIPLTDPTKLDTLPTSKNLSGYKRFLVSLVKARNTLRGCGLTNNATDATNDIDFAAGYCTDIDDGVVLVCTAMTKRLDAAWAAGTGNGGLDTGSIANTTYHCWAITTAKGIQDWLFSTSATAPTMPTGYTVKRRVGAFRRTGGAIVLFVQDGDEFKISVPTKDINVTNPGTAAVTRTLSVPTGIKVWALLTLFAYDNDLTALRDVHHYWSALSQTDTAASTNLFDIHTHTEVGVRSYDSVFRAIITNTSAQIRSRCDVSDVNVSQQIVTHGWIDRRGRDD